MKYSLLYELKMFFDFINCWMGKFRFMIASYTLEVVKKESIYLEKKLKNKRYCEQRNSQKQIEVFQI